MYFKKSNRFCDENLTIKSVLEAMSPAQVCGVALLYMEYRLNYNKKDTTDKDTKCKLCVLMLFQEAIAGNFRDDFFNVDDFKHQVGRVVNRTGGWQTLDCILDWMELESGPTGRMDFQRKAEILQVFKLVLEEYYELPVSRIVKYASALND